MSYNVNMGSIAGIVSGVFVSITGATDGNFSFGDALQVGKVIYAVEQKQTSLADDMRHDSTELENVLHELNHSIAELEKQMAEAEAEQLPKMFAGMEGTL